MTPWEDYQLTLTAVSEMRQQAKQIEHDAAVELLEEQGKCPHTWKTGQYGFITCTRCGWDQLCAPRL